MHDKRTQENIRRNRGRRGAGLEMAMLLMLVAVALSGLLTSAAMMQIDKQKDSGEQLELLEQRMWLDRIGRDFCSHRANYVLPEGVNGTVTYRYGAAESCPGCCAGCTECDGIYTEQEGEGSAEPAEAAENADGNESTGDNETTENTERPTCCNACTECTKGCTQYTKISLVVRSDSGEVVLTVELTNNQDGTYTVTEWSYGE